MSFKKHHGHNDLGKRVSKQVADGGAIHGLILVFGETLKTTDLSAMLLPKMLQEVAPYADHASVSLTRRAGVDLDQPDSGGADRPCHLTPRQLALPAMCDAFLCHPQFLTSAIPGICLALAVPFAWCSRCASSFDATPTVPAKSSPNGFQISLKPPLA